MSIAAGTDTGSAAIYFDGILPDAKKPTRIARLQAYLDQLINFRALYSQGVPSVAQNTDRDAEGPSDLFAVRHVPAKLSALPASPFLVPAVIEAVLASQFAEVTRVVAGEADAYCADQARKHGGTVLTSDSDLVAHDLGPDGAVVFFKDLQIDESTTGETMLKGTRYVPAEIAEALGLKGLTAFAFAVEKDRHRTFKECVNLAKQQPDDDPKYDVFRREYSSIGLHSALAGRMNGSLPQSLQKVLESLDPRISEYVHQLPPPKPEQARTNRDYKMYLPFLIDDPTRASAWNSGASVRRLGYSILNLTTLSLSRIMEYGRRGGRIASTGTSFLAAKEIVSSCRTLFNILDDECDVYMQLPLPAVWRLIGMYLVCQSLIEDGKPLPSRNDVKLLLSGQHAGSSWAYIHVSAQLQAALYSLRMLGQFLNVFFAAYSSSLDAKEFASLLRDLQRHLNALPPLHELFPPARLEREERVWNEAVMKLFDMLGVQENAFLEPREKSKRKRKRKRDANQDAASKETPKQPSNNVYDLLADS